MVMLLLGLALAADPALDAPIPQPPPPTEPGPPDPSDPGPDVRMPFGRTVEETIGDAVTLRQRGDLAGARALLVTLEPQVPAAGLGAYLYQRGICEELGNAPDAARAFYEQVIALGGDFAVDAHFRRALVLEDLGLYEAALDEVLLLDKVRGLSADDELTVSLQRGISELNTGKRTRGIRRIQKALAATEGGDTHRYLRAKARYHLARALLDEADALSLTGPERRVVKRLEGRALRIKAAEQQIIALTSLQEPEWVLASLISLGDSYGRLATDLAASAPPKRLDPAQVEIYRAEVGKKAENVRTKSFHAYDSGVALATRLAWESLRVATLKERRAAFDGQR
ncbi:MAG: hypothetical protein Q8P41_07900 [Pseudomonadota bacterium]|nr:hypothetical protein [Pseudomonadota bacterium]